MNNADHPRNAERLLWVDPETGSYREDTLARLPAYLRPSDLLVVNDAATLPASLPARWKGSEATLELRLAGGGRDESEWWVVLFGPGDWRTPTEHRPPPPEVAPGDRLWIGEALFARVLEISTLSARLVRVVFNARGEEFYRELYRHGHPVQYSYVREDLKLWDVQTHYGARPWAVEMPSAGRPLNWEILAAVRRRGVGVTRLTHAAGLSSTGDPDLDARLPLPERYELPEATVQAVETARGEGGRILAVGTSTVRALEGNATLNHGRLRAGAGTIDLVLGPDYERKVVDGLLTGVHEAGSSHFALMESFAPRPRLEHALAHAETRGFLQHEFGDSMLLWPHAPRSTMLVTAA
jgi:S-adenosylmethionine:tRNA ribosyltransferase-isomerase